MVTPQQQCSPPAKDGDWNNYRDIIITLYLEQNKSLKEVMRIMRENYHFFATEKMYKIRFNKWGIHKKLRAPQVAELLAQRGRRAAAGKSTVSFVHGRKIDADRLEAYLRRVSPTSRKAITDILVGNVVPTDAQKRSVYEIVCRTPSPEPNPVFAPKRVEAPDSLRLPEDCMQIVQSYVKGALENVWPLTPDKRVICPLRPRTWLDPVSSARQLFVNNFREQGFRMLNITFESYREVLLRQDPSLLVETCLALGALLQSGPGLAEAFVKYAYSMSQITLGPRHPLHLIFGRLNAVGPAEMPGLMALIIRGFLQEIQANYCLKPTWLATVYRAMLNSRFIGADTATRYMQELVTDLNSLSPLSEHDAAKKAHNLDDMRLLQDHLSWITNFHDKPTEASMSAHTLAATRGRKNPRMTRFSCYNMLRTFPTSRGVSSQEAIDLMRASLAICEEEFGRNDNATVTLLATLHGFLARAGRAEEAQKVREDFETRWNEAMGDTLGGRIA
ncbi:Clr5 domain-containing protein [Daldinia caldariorum]|uniref:Clr5 domain-containing protein n=1 Tax=Daldinia caldariorum TaxID=326644 RepID=UPI0020074F94|nr:Clr5 domain-containing protein [Daldinia caldariorum]KAI1468877.1 Clr5 domain-containing protein [Daldinia caldariorum]